MSGLYNIFIGAVFYPMAIVLFGLAFAILSEVAKHWTMMAAGMAAVLLGPALAASAVAAAFSRKGRMTPGGRLVGLAVVEPGGDDIGYIRACLRYLLYGLCLLPFGAGIWWAAIDREGRTWPDMAMGTRVVHRGDGGQGLPAALLVIYGLGAALLAGGFFVFLNLMGLFSFPDAAYIGMGSGLLGSIALMLAAAVAKILFRRNVEAKRVAGGAFTIGFILFLGAIFAAATMPSNAALMKAHRFQGSRQAILDAGLKAERFTAEKGRPPSGWSELTDSGYFQAAPWSGDKELVLRAEPAGRDTIFVIEYPVPDQLLIPRGFWPAKACSVLRYRQGKGIEIK